VFALHLPSRRQQVRRDVDYVLVADEFPITFYWPSVSGVAEDGTIVMRATGYTAGGAEHWTGAHKVKPDSPDYSFWRWVVAHKKRWTHFFPDADLPKIRAEYEKDAA
jgi:hypothetical protein